MQVPDDRLLSDALREMVMTVTVTRNMWTRLRVRIGAYIIYLGARVAGLGIVIRTED